MTEPRETYRLKKTTSANTTARIRQRKGWLPRMNPAAVATPLPPRKPKKTGNICPMTAKSPAMYMVMGPPSSRPIQAARAPLAASPASTSAAESFP